MSPEIITASIAAIASIVCAVLVRMTQKQVKPSNGGTLAKLIERIDERLYDHVTDPDVHHLESRHRRKHQSQ